MALSSKRLRKAFHFGFRGGRWLTQNAQMKKIAGWSGFLPLSAAFGLYFALFKDAGICYNLAKTGRMEMAEWMIRILK